VKQFDVFRAPDGTLLCVLQHGFLLDRETIMACPLNPTDDPVVKGLTPVVMLEGERYLLDVTTQVSIRAAPLRRLSSVASLEEQRDAILDAVSLVYWGL